jgi:hypothetical protein
MAKPRSTDPIEPMTLGTMRAKGVRSLDVRVAFILGHARGAEPRCRPGSPISRTGGPGRSTMCADFRRNNQGVSGRPGRQEGRPGVGPTRRVDPRLNHTG